MGRWRCAVAGLLLAGLSSAVGVSWQRNRDARVILRMQAQHVEHQQQRMAHGGPLRLERSQRATALLASEGREYDALALGILAAFPPSPDEAVPLPLQPGLIHADRAVTGSRRLAQPSKELTSLEISPDGTQILSATGQGLAEISDAQTGQTVGTLSLPDGAITTALFAPDGKDIATLSRDGLVHSWNAQSCQPKQIGGGPQHRFQAIASAASGRLACAGSDQKKRTRSDGEVRLLGGYLILPTERDKTAQSAAAGREALVRWYKARAAERVQARVPTWVAKLGVTPRQIWIRDPKSRWGSADRDGNLRFNWRIVQAPTARLDCAIAHALAPLLHPDHTPAFWSALGHAMPDYEARRETLRRLGPKLVW